MTSLYLTRVYQRSFETHPHTTLAVTGGAFNVLGDFVAQISQIVLHRKHEDRRDYDFLRTLRFFCFGFAITPFIGRWNLFLEKRFPLIADNTKGRISLKALSKRVVSDQIVMAPTGLAVFVGSMGIMEGRNWKQLQQKYSELYQPALLTNWKVWPVAQFINFRYMPLPYRVPFQSTCGVFWTLYLSILNTNESQEQHKSN